MSVAMKRTPSKSSQKCVRELFQYRPGVSSAPERNLFLVQKRLADILDFNSNFDGSQSVWSSPKCVKRKDGPGGGGAATGDPSKRPKPLVDVWNVGVETSTGNLVELGPEYKDDLDGGGEEVVQNARPSGGVRRIGIYTMEERKQRIQRFMDHRKKRIGAHAIRYTKRKTSANMRCRVNGRFAKVNADGEFVSEDPSGLDLLVATAGAVQEDHDPWDSALTSKEEISTFAPATVQVQVSRNKEADEVAQVPGWSESGRTHKPESIEMTSALHPTEWPSRPALYT
jgi:hypothetical protein